MAHKHRSDIDGLRALAVLLVVSFHAFPLWVPGGFIGVDVFFVISGYLITALILDSQAAGTFRLSDFYMRRARRILPSLCLVISATLILGWLFLFPAPYRKLGWEGISGALFFPNFLYWSEAGYFDGIGQSKPLLHLWSLGVEEQFYFVWPALLILLQRWRTRLTAILCLVSVASFVYSTIAVFHYPAAAFYSPASRLWELGAGGILACRPVKFRRPVAASLVGLVLIILSAFGLNERSAFPGVLALPPVLGTALVIAGRSPVLDLRPLVGLGLVSYPFYLWHWPLLSFANTLDFHTELAKLVVVIVACALAWVTTHYVERPIRFGRLRHAGAAISVAGTALAALGALLIAGFDGFADRYPSDVRTAIAVKEFVAGAPERLDSCWIDTDDNFSRFKPECRDGKVLIWGDSYSGMLSTGFPKPYAQFTRSGCAPLLTGDADPCSVGNAVAADEILRLKPERVVLFARWLLHVPDWRSAPKAQQQLANTLAKLRQRIGEVVLVGPTPEWVPDLPDLVYRYWRKYRELPDRLGSATQNQRDSDNAMRAVAIQQQVRFVSLLAALCSADGCITHTPRSRSQLLAFDYGHFTVEGATYIVQSLGLDGSDLIDLSQVSDCCR